MSEKKGQTRQFLKIIQEIGTINDYTLLMEKVLHSSRTFLGADAGTIYLKKDDRLFFSFIENDTLFKDIDPRQKYVYAHKSIPVNSDSLAGYVASAGEALIIDDVYDIKSTINFSFNPEFDKEAHYRTTSLLVVPLKTSNADILGVIQLINKKSDSQNIVPFSMNDRMYLNYFSKVAADALEKAELARSMVMRMVEMVELRDPAEDRAHANRVGDYAVELFDAWAARKGLKESERMMKKDMFRTAAILHDVGKVSVADNIFNKSHSLSGKDRRKVIEHTITGARLFRNPVSLWDKVAHEVILHHHERWDGNGYPGNVKNLDSIPPADNPGLKGTRIPLSARIVAIAEVFDALICDRPYRKKISPDEAMKFIANEKGKQFDPDLVEIFLQIYDTVLAIVQRYE